MELTQGRHFDSYGSSMDAVLDEKARDIEPWLVPGLIVDRGCGTGALMRHLAGKNHKVVGIEVSDALSKDLPGVVNADVSDRVFADGFASNVILSSVLHEVYSYKGYSLYAVAACLAVCAQELRRGGRLIYRDIWSPPYGAINDVHLKMDRTTASKFKDYLAKIPVSDEQHDVSDLRCWQESSQPDGCAIMSCRMAVEFLSKKDYVKHWDLECREVYTAVKMDDLIRMAAPLGMRVFEAKPLRNDWIVANRWSKGAEWKWRSKTWPKDQKIYTNQLVVLEKI